MTSNLYDLIQSRPRPEDVAETVLELIGSNLSPERRKIVDRAASGSLRRSTWRYSSMAADFVRYPGAEKQVRKGSELFVVPPLSSMDCDNPAKVTAFLDDIAGKISWSRGQDFKGGRLTRAQRKETKTIPGHRAYNKRVRYLIRLEDKIRRMIRNGLKFDHSHMAKSALATRLSQEEIDRDLPTACFIAYQTARMNLRSQFTNGPQVRAFDVVADALYKHAVAAGNPNWWAIAHVHSEPEVLKHLTPEQKGRLLGMWFNELQSIGDFLHTLQVENNIDIGTMVVHRGQDSTSWNASAGAWNKVRSEWFDILFSMGAHQILEQFCPGKVLRLMAADVVRWSSSLHPDTYVWKELPAPWKVLRGEVPCTRAMVLAACEKHKVPSGGWCDARPPKNAVNFTVTPELVHGVTVTSPDLAKVLRNAGVFSGKNLKDVNLPDFRVVRDEFGAAIRVDNA